MKEEQCDKCGLIKEIVYRTTDIDDIPFLLCESCAIEIYFTLRDRFD